MCEKDKRNREVVEQGRYKRLLTTEEAAKYIRVEKETLAVWRSTKRYKIPYTKVGRLVRYRISDLEEFIEKYYEGAKEEVEEEVVDKGEKLGRGKKKTNNKQPRTRRSK